MPVAEKEVYIYIYIYMCICMYVCMCAFVHGCMHSCMHGSMYRSATGFQAHGALQRPQGAILCLFNCYIFVCFVF